MLKILRSAVGGWVAKILLVLLVASFAVWGVSGTILTAGSSNSIASVGETNVSIPQFIAAYNRSRNAMSRQIGTRLTQKQARAFGVEQRTLTDVVTSATLDEFTREMNMSLSQDTLAKMIGENPAFHSSAGKFSRQRFQNAVRQAGMRETDFVNAQNSNAIRSQVMEGIATGDILPKVFNKALAAYANEERKFEYVTITPALADKPLPATDGDLKTFFETNIKKYAAPEYRKLSILALEPKNLADEQLIADETVRKDYDSRQDAFRTPEKRRVQQIVLTKEKAEKAINDMKSGATFETVLADNNVKLTDADLGLVEKLAGELHDAIDEALLNQRLTHDLARKLTVRQLARRHDESSFASLLQVMEEVHDPHRIRVAGSERHRSFRADPKPRVLGGYLINAPTVLGLAAVVERRIGEDEVRAQVDRLGRGLNLETFLRRTACSRNRFVLGVDLFLAFFGLVEFGHEQIGRAHV